jgi:hypothetical protein
MQAFPQRNIVINSAVVFIMKLRGASTLKLFGFTRIQSSIAAAFSCLILFTTIIMSFISYSLSTDAVGKKSQDSTSQIIDQVNRNIKSYITNMEYISLMALNNANVRDYMLASSQNKVPNNNEAIPKIRDFFHSVLSSRKMLRLLCWRVNTARILYLTVKRRI